MRIFQPHFEKFNWNPSHYMPQVAANVQGAIPPQTNACAAMPLAYWISSATLYLSATTFQRISAGQLFRLLLQLAPLAPPWWCLRLCHLEARGATRIFGADALFSLSSYGSSLGGAQGARTLSKSSCRGPFGRFLRNHMLHGRSGSRADGASWRIPSWRLVSVSQGRLCWTTDRIGDINRSRKVGGDDVVTFSRPAVELGFPPLESITVSAIGRQRISTLTSTLH